MTLSDMQDKEQIRRADRESKQLITRIACPHVVLPRPEPDTKNYKRHKLDFKMLLTKGDVKLTSI